MVTCSVCKSEMPADQLTPAGVVQPAVAALIREDHAGWSDDGLICRDDLSRYRRRAVESMLETDRGELDALEAQVLASINDQALVSENPNDAFREESSVGQKVADSVAAFGGSWRFILGFLFFLIAWIVINSLILLFRPFDPYPFILLNLILSSLAALQAPVIMMSQNRQEAKDRLRSQGDYRTDLKAELEVRLLHEKLDHLQAHQWQRLLEIQRLQVELLEELSRRMDAAARKTS